MKRWYPKCFRSPRHLNRTVTAMLSNASDPMGGKTASGLASSLSVRSGSLLCTRQHTHPSGLENAQAVPPYSSVHVYRWRRAREDDMLLMWSILYGGPPHDSEIAPRPRAIRVQQRRRGCGEGRSRGPRRVPVIGRRELGHVKFEFLVPVLRALRFVGRFATL